MNNYEVSETIFDDNGVEINRGDMVMTNKWNKVAFICCGLIMLFIKMTHSDGICLPKLKELNPIDCISCNISLVDIIGEENIQFQKFVLNLWLKNHR